MLRVLSKGFEVKMSTGGSKMSSDSNGLNSSTGLKVVNNMKFTTLLSFSQSPRIPTPTARVDHPQLPMPAVPPVNQSMEVYLHFLYSMSRQGNNASHSGESTSLGMFSTQELSTGPSYPGI
jgi:hypothetical protein